MRDSIPAKPVAWPPPWLRAHEEGEPAPAEPPATEPEPAPVEPTPPEDAGPIEPTPAEPSPSSPPDASPRLIPAADLHPKQLRAYYLRRRTGHPYRWPIHSQPGIPSPLAPCPWCGAWAWWRSACGVVACGFCTPPSAASEILEWLEPSDN